MAASSHHSPSSPRRMEVGEIARAYGATLRAQCALTAEQHAVLTAIERCRTAALGGHLHVCDHCSYSVPVYNSCRNRHCPNCQSLDQHRWLERRSERILPVPYFHLVFTLPAELRPIVLRHRELLFTMLMRAASETILTLAHDDKRLGATPAVTMVLHTWTRELVFHPHVHAIVSAGGLRCHEHPRWVSSRARYLFPVKVMGKLFRRLFRTALLTAIEQGQLSLPADTVASLRVVLFDKRWVVYAKQPFGGAEQVFGYLGHYTHRVGISNARILSTDGDMVTFATKHGSTCTLPQVEFLRRLLQHVLPKGFHKIRHYGLVSATQIRLDGLDQARALLDPGSTPSATTAPKSWIECLLALTGVDLMRCPRCRVGTMMLQPLTSDSRPRAHDTS